MLRKIYQKGQFFDSDKLYIGVESLKERELKMVSVSNLNLNQIGKAAQLLNQVGAFNGTKTNSLSSTSIFSALGSTTSTNSTSSQLGIKSITSSLLASKDDGKDDGKLSFGESVKSIFKGVVKSFTNMFSSPKNIAKTVIGGVACAALIAVTGGAATPFIIAGGVALGGVQVGKGIYDASQAKTDDEKRAALENIGGGAATIAMSVAAGKAYSSATGSSLTSLSTYKNAATNSINNAQAFMKLSPAAAKAEIASVSSLDKSVNWMQDDKALNSMYQADATGTMKKFGYQLLQGNAKNAQGAQPGEDEMNEMAANIAKKSNFFQA